MKLLAVADPPTFTDCLRLDSLHYDAVNGFTKIDCIASCKVKNVWLFGAFSLIAIACKSLYTIKFLSCTIYYSLIHCMPLSLRGCLSTPPRYTTGVSSLSQHFWPCHIITLRACARHKVIGRVVVIIVVIVISTKIIISRGLGT